MKCCDVDVKRAGAQIAHPSFTFGVARWTVRVRAKNRAINMFGVRLTAPRGRPSQQML
jgi:hypothetical protein